ncbi:40S ribosomal S21 [Paramuricea clavata]|uniref:40S ribosomal protein S21 n=1 Tax=Paramuricea clavata TaxID=317549 RepID=A0A6S7FPZ1_PARCT|nr:40S ribosomal S21 [Paramuricea clavata]
MQNDGGEVVDTYIPRKCSVTNRIIAAKDHASVQINVGELDENGRYTNNFKTYAFSGFLRNSGDSDEALVRLCIKDGVVSPTITE